MFWMFFFSEISAEMRWDDKGFFQTDTDMERREKNVETGKVETPRVHETDEHILDMLMWP